MKKIIRRFFNLPATIGLVLGGFGGYAYYFFYSCAGNSCSITSNPWGALACGLIIGWLLGDAFYKNKDDKTKNSPS